MTCQIVPNHVDTLKDIKIDRRRIEDQGKEILYMGKDKIALKQLWKPKPKPVSKQYVIFSCNYHVKYISSIS